MRKTFYYALAVALLLTTAVMAHHPAADIVDEEVYLNIEEMVADTPHANLDFEDMDGDMMITISTQEVADLEAMITDYGLIADVSLLSGRVSVDITFRGSGRTVFTVTQLK